MSKWPERRVSLPQDQPTRYLDAGLERMSVRIWGLISLASSQVNNCLAL